VTARVRVVHLVGRTRGRTRCGRRAKGLAWTSNAALFTCRVCERLAMRVIVFEGER
jgi:hypothetical protein